MVNLLDITESVLKNNGKTFKDIEWIGCESYTIPIDNFKKIADVEINEESYEEEVFIDLVICGDDWWMERATYDGNEWWEFRAIPTKPNEKRGDIESLTITGTNQYLKNL